MTRIGKYLHTTVTIVKVSLSAGDRSETLIENVPAAVFERDSFTQTLSGKATLSRTFVAFDPDISGVTEWIGGGSIEWLSGGETEGIGEIVGQDEIIINGVRRPVIDISLVRISRFVSAIDHIEVEVG